MDDDIAQPRQRLSAEAAALIRDFLAKSLADFESDYLVELLEYQRKREAIRHAREMSPTEPWRNRRPDEPF